MSTTLGLIGLSVFVLLWAWIWFAGCDAAFNPDYDDADEDE